jgi:hypothetical protein
MTRNFSTCLAVLMLGATATLQAQMSQTLLVQADGATRVFAKH